MQKKHMLFLSFGVVTPTKKGACIDKNKHLVIQAAHPSPLSAHRGFFGQCYFSRTNAYLQETGQVPIAWALQKEEKQKELFLSLMVVKIMRFKHKKRPPLAWRSFKSCLKSLGLLMYAQFFAPV